MKLRLERLSRKKVKRIARIQLRESYDSGSKLYSRSRHVGGSVACVKPPNGNPEALGTSASTNFFLEFLMAALHDLIRLKADERIYGLTPSRRQRDQVPRGGLPATIGSATW